MRKLALLLSALILALGAVGFSACGDDEETTSADTAATTETTGGDGGGGGATLSVSADPGGELAFTETELTTTAGSNTIEFDNPASIPHDVVVEDDGGNEIGRTETISGDTATATVELEPGTYTYFCSVPGHRDAGMEGTLTVE